jgi:hypothetical protein
LRFRLILAPNYLLMTLIRVFVTHGVTWHNSYSHATNECNIFCRQVQLGINKGRLKFAESPQIKLDKDPFLVKMHMVEFDEKKVLV